MLTATPRRLAGAGLAVAVIAVTAAPAEAATIVPTRFDDPAGAGACPSECSLRQALAAAAPGDTVELEAGAYTLEQGSLQPPNGVAIVGAGAAETTIRQRDGSGERVVWVQAGRSAELSDLTIANGDLRQTSDPSVGAGGSGVLHQGDELTLDRVVVTQNATTGFTSGRPAFNGGAVSTGGESGTLTIRDSAITANSWHSGLVHGGGLTLVADQGSARIARTEISGNGAISGAGLLIRTDAPVRVVSSTIAQNVAAHGGGIHSNLYPVDVAITGSTIANNAAYAGSGGNLGFARGITIRGSIVAGGTSPTAGGQNCSTDTASADPTSAGGNVEDLDECGFGAAGDQPSTDPRLAGALAANGSAGPARTLALAPDSPAINALDPAQCVEGSGAPLADDGRRFARPQGPRCDAGAYELRAPVASSPPAITGTPEEGSPLRCSDPGFASPDGGAVSATTYRWLRDGTAIAGASESTYTPTAGDAGRELRCEASAANAAGSASEVSGPVTVRGSDPAPGGGGVGGSGTGASGAGDGGSGPQPDAGSGPTGSDADTTPPAIEALRLDRRAFVAAKRDTEPRARRPRGTTIRFTLSEASLVKFRVRRDPPRVNGAPPPRFPHTFTRELDAGEQAVRFSGRLGGRTFPPGRYRMYLRAWDEAGNRSELEFVRFRIVEPKP
jgi:hypothetical protein